LGRDKLFVKKSQENIFHHLHCLFFGQGKSLFWSGKKFLLFWSGITFSSGKLGGKKLFVSFPKVREYFSPLKFIFFSGQGKFSFFGQGKSVYFFGQG